MKRLILFFALFLSLVAYSQNTSPLVVKDFMLKANEIIDMDQVPKDARTDWDSNPICRIKVRAAGFDENLMQKFTFVPNGIHIMHKTVKDGQVYLYVSSNKTGEIKIVYMGDCVFKLPYKLDAKKTYELVLGMETATLVISSVPSTADIYVDGKKIGTGYGSAAVSVGSEHRYKVVCADYFPEEDVIITDKIERINRQVELRPNFGYITIKSEPSGADVYIDEQKVGVTPYLMKKIRLGRHSVELRKEQFEPYADMVLIKVDEVNKQFENVALKAIRVPMGSLDLTSDPSGAVITINGRQYGQTPQVLTDFETGKYTVYFTKEGYENLVQTVTVKDGKTETLAVTMTKRNAQLLVPTTNE